MKLGQLLFEGNPHHPETYQTLCFYGEKQPVFSAQKILFMLFLKVLLVALNFAPFLQFPLQI